MGGEDDAEAGAPPASDHGGGTGRRRGRGGGDGHRGRAGAAATSVGVEVETPTGRRPMAMAADGAGRGPERRKTEKVRVGEKGREEEVQIVLTPTLKMCSRPQGRFTSFSFFGGPTVCFIDVGIVIFYSVPGNSRRCLRKSRRNPYIGLMIATAEVGMKFIC